MILVDTSIIVAWLDAAHPQHKECTQALARCAGEDELAVSVVTYGELSAGGRTREAIEEDLRMFRKLDLEADAAYRAGAAFRRHRWSGGEARPVLPDFMIRAQAASLGIPHLTNDRRRRTGFPDVEFLFP